MKIHELIEKLRDYPQEAEVVVEVDFGNDYQNCEIDGASPNVDKHEAKQVVLVLGSFVQ